MPEAETETEAPAAAPAPAPKKTSLFSPVAFAVVGILMLVTAVLTFFVTKYLASEELDYGGLEWDYEQVDLGAFTRDVPTDDLGRYKEKFTVEIALVLNPAYGELAQLKTDVEKRRDYLKDIVNREILFNKNPEEFRKPNILNNLSDEVLKRLNEELGYTEGGQEVIRRVIYSKVVSVPRPR